MIGCSSFSEARLLLNCTGKWYEENSGENCYPHLPPKTSKSIHLPAIIVSGSELHNAIADGKHDAIHIIPLRNSIKLDTSSPLFRSEPVIAITLKFDWIVREDDGW